MSDCPDEVNAPSEQHAPITKIRRQNLIGGDLYSIIALWRVQERRRHFFFFFVDLG